MFNLEFLYLVRRAQEVDVHAQLPKVSTNRHPNQNLQTLSTILRTKPMIPNFKVEHLVRQAQEVDVHTPLFRIPQMKRHTDRYLRPPPTLLPAQIPSADVLDRLPHQSLQRLRFVPAWFLSATE